MSIQRYPVGHQDFAKIIRQGFVYVDKTEFVNKLAERGGYYFLSRPRRFGKSLLISTFDYLFRGKKELFKGLYIYDKWDFEEHPVIRISFSEIGYRTSDLSSAINSRLSEISEEYGLKLKNDGIDKKFRELIHILHQKFNRQVAILIDEYDKPMIDYLDKDNLHKAIDNRSTLKSFYSILKDADRHLKMVLITGVSKFSQVSIFSDLNNLNDISLDHEYNSICGINQSELEINFKEELKIYDKEKIREWYNGYRWDVDANSVYNPFSLLNFFDKGGKFTNFWYTTGTPSFLMKMCKEQHLYELNDVTLTQTGLNSFDIENLNILPILFQTGYLTLSSYNSLLGIYHLDYPNNEVKRSFIEGLLEVFTESKEPISSAILNKLYKAITQHTKKDLEEAIDLAFAHIPYDLWHKENEKFYHTILHLLFSLLGVHIESEVHTKNGRADAIIHFENNIYCMEFKLDKSAEEAIQQIEKRGYLEKYEDSGKTLHKIGLNFNSENKKVDGIIWEVVK